MEFAQSPYVFVGGFQGPHFPPTSQRCAQVVSALSQSESVCVCVHMHVHTHALQWKGVLSRVGVCLALRAAGLRKAPAMCNPELALGFLLILNVYIAQLFQCLILEVV